MDCSKPGFPVNHLAQTQVHRVSDAIQPPHPLSSPSAPTFNLSQHQGLFQWVGSSHQVTKALELQLPVNVQGWFPLGLTGLISLQSKGLSQESSPTPQFKSINSSVLRLLYGPTLTSIMTPGKTIALTIWTFSGKVMPLLFNTLSRFVIVLIPFSTSV